MKNAKYQLCNHNCNFQPKSISRIFISSVVFYFTLREEVCDVNIFKLKKYALKEMFIRHKIFVFYSILGLLFLLHKVSGDTDLSLLVSDYNIVDQDICHSIIKENPCAKNVLKILIDRIDILVDKIDDMERNQVKLQDQVSLLQSDVAIKEQQIHTLEDKLLGIVENKKRSVSAQNVYSNDLLQPSSSIDNSLYSFVRTSNESNWIANNEKGRQKHSWTTVR